MNLRNTTIHFVSVAIFAMVLIVGCQHQNKSTATKEKGRIVFDSTLWKETGADEYGMKQYVLVFLKNGPKRNQDSAEVSRIQKAHLDNILKLADEGKLVVAGPFMDDQEVKGIFILNTANLEEAKKIAVTDPAVKAGRLIMELHPWYGSAALMKVNSLHKTLEKKSVFR